MERTVVLYHGNCPDGFGGAYAAWKKFGDSAEYIALSRTMPEPETFADAHLYFIDFCYPKEVMDRYVAHSLSLTMLDHHEGIEDVVRTMPEYVYDNNRSGATIAWSYFHPDAEVPELLKFVEDDDLFHFVLLDTKAVIGYLAVQPFTFENWDAIAAKLADPAERGALLEKARIYREYFDMLVAYTAGRAKPILFEGHTVYGVTVNPLKPFVSAVGRALYSEHPPMALMFHMYAGGMRVSLRSDESIDVAAIAQKYGGNGHTNSAAFNLPWGTPLPWTTPDDERTGH